MLNTPFSPWPSFTEEEIKAVQHVLSSNRVNYWTGLECREFEKEFAAWCGTNYAVALANGTLALDLALKALGIGPGDEVIVTPRTFIASVSCIVNAGAVPIFADVDIKSGNISSQTIKKVLTPRTKAIICVHLAGWPCDMDPIMTLANQYNLKVIEDCAQAHGALYKGKSVGSIGHIGAWSFCQDKIMTTGGEGGMVTTNDEILWRSMWSFKDHGKSYEAVYERKHPPGFRWLHDSFGTNWRMLEIQGVIGRIQLKKMKEWSTQRARNVKAIQETCLSLPALYVPQFGCLKCTNPGDSESVPACCRHAYYRCYIYIRPDFLKINWSRDKIIEEITRRGVPCYQGTCSEVYLEKAFDGTHWRPEQRLPIAQKLGETSLMFLVHPTLKDYEIQKTCMVISDVIKKATKS